MGGTQTRKGVGGVGLVTVKEVFGVEHGLAVFGYDMGEAVGDGLTVFFKRDAEGGGDVELMAFADEADGRRVGIQHGGQNVIVVSRAAHPFGHAKRGHGGAGLRRGGEEFGL